MYAGSDDSTGRSRNVMAFRFLSCGGLYSSTRALRPLINVACNEEMTSSTASVGTSTVENLCVISMAPMSRPDRLVSPAIAPTRSCGRIFAAWPRLTNTRDVAPAGRRCCVGRGDALARRRGTDLGDVLVLVEVVRLVRELDRGQRDLHQVVVVGEGVDDDAELVGVAVLRARPATRRG